MIMIVRTSNRGPLNLRASTSTGSKIIAQIPYGTKLEVTTVNNLWYKTIYNGNEGYVMSQYLAETEATYDKTKLQAIYNSLKDTLNLIEKAMS